MQSDKVILFCETKLLLKKSEESDFFELPSLEEMMSFEKLSELNNFIFDGIKYHYGRINSAPYGMTLLGLRESWKCVDPATYKVSGKASELLYWDESTKYCSVCGAILPKIDGIMKKCSCGREYYPSVAPAIIVRITKGDEILLIRAKNFRGTFWGQVAGFVETGESLEDCVKREVMEEVGLTIKNIKYFDSQPWPYPFGLMVGFTAEYESGDVTIQESELNQARFFKKDNLPELSLGLSLGRRLIDDWIMH